MGTLKEFSIPIKGLKQEHYEFDFQIDKSFFKCFEDAPISDAEIEVYLDLDKRTGMMELFFDIVGTIKTDCDRCLAAINLPIETEQHLIIKYSEEAQEDTDEVIYIHPETSDLNVAQYIYEYICLAIPFTKTYDCENDEVPPCDFEMLNRIAQQEQNSKEDQQAIDDAHPLGDLLKDININ